MKVNAPTDWSIAWQTRFIPVEDGPVMEVASNVTHRGKSFKVDSARVTYHPVNGGWVASVWVSGCGIKKDGTVGTQRLDNSYGYMTSEGTPEWVRLLAAHFTPSAPAPTSTTEAFIYE